MALDECTPFPATPDQALLQCTLDALGQRIEAGAFVPRPGAMGLFGMVQGSVFPDLSAAHQPKH